MIAQYGYLWLPCFRCYYVMFLPCYKCLSLSKYCHLCQQNHVLYFKHCTFDTVTAQQMSAAIRSPATSIQRPIGKLQCAKNVYIPISFHCTCWVECSIRVSVKLMCIIRRILLPILKAVFSAANLSPINVIGRLTATNYWELISH